MEKSWAFAGGHDLVDFSGAYVESPWVPPLVTGTGFQEKYRYRLTTWARDWTWPITVRATAADLVAGEASQVILEGLPGLGSFANGTFASIDMKVRARTLGETVLEGDWFPYFEQGLDARGSGPAPLSGMLAIPEDVCINTSLVPKTDLLPSDLSPLTFNVCMFDQLLGAPLRVGANASWGAVTPSAAELGGAPAEVLVTPASGRFSLRLSAADWTPTVVDLVKWKITTVLGITVWEVVEEEYQRAEEAFSYKPWPPPDGTGYHGEPPPPLVFEFTARPGVSAVNPVNGPMAGGTTVTLTGGAFEGATRACFGATCVGADGFQVISDSEIRVTAPAIQDAPEAVTVHVTVTGPTGTSPERDHNRFRYLPRPRVTSLEPSSGIATGGSPVAVHGRGFTTATTVDFGESEALSFLVVSDLLVTSTSPAGASRSHVRVTSTCEEPPPLEETLATSCGASPAGPDDLFTWVSLVALDPEAAFAVRLDGGASVEAAGAAWIDSASPEAVVAVGRAELHADPEIGLVGGARLAGGAALVPEPITGAAPVPDPLAWLAPVDASTLPVRARRLHVVHGSHALEPGLYDGGAVFTGTARISLTPGVYVFRGDVALLGNARVEGPGDVLVVLEPAPGADGCSSLELHGNTLLALGASRDPARYGVSLDVRGPCDADDVVRVAGGGALEVAGAIHAAGGTFQAHGGSPAVAGALVVGRLDVRGGVAVALRLPPPEAPPAARSSAPPPP